MAEHPMVFSALLGIAGIACMGFLIARLVRRRAFLQRYGIDSLPKSVHIRKSRHWAYENHYVLRYPRWAVSKRDGTADGRSKRNRILWNPCYLYVDDYLIHSDRPYDLIKVVKSLRLQGVEIALCPEEERKYADLLKKQEAFAYHDGIQNIVQYYMENPTDFEALCADLFNRLGYDAELTPRTNDGGYDILLYAGAERIIVECKCYAEAHKVGRPSIQKLVGANRLVLAERMLFITTSGFSNAAVTYAEQAGVELIDGHALIDLLDANGFLQKETREITELECQLEVCDLYPHVPADIYGVFFK